MTDKKKWFTLILWVLFICWCLFSVLSQWHYLPYGIDVTDDAFWTSESYLVINGAVPVVDNWSQTPLTQLLISPFVWAYISLAKGTAGVFLFMNHVAFFYRLLICTAIFILFKKRISSFPAACYVLLFFVASVGGRTLNYSVLSQYLLCLAGVLLFLTAEIDSDKTAAFLSASAGAVMAVCALAHVTQLVNCAFLLLLNFLLNKRRYKNIPIWCYYASTGIGFAAFTLTLLHVLGGNGVLSGAENMLQYNYFKITRMAFQEHIKRLLVTLLEMLKIWLPIFIMCGLGLFFCFYLYFKNWNAAIKKAGALTIPVATCSFYLIFYCKYGASLLGTSNTFFSERAAFLTFCLLPLYLPLIRLHKKQAKLLCAFLWVPNIISLILICVSSHAPSTTRLYILYSGGILTVIFIFWSIVENFADKEGITHSKTCGSAKAISMFFTMVVVYGLLITQYSSIYRDEPINKLTSRVSTGVYRDMYTTPARAVAIQELEQSLKAQIDPSKTVLYADLMPSAYMMTQAQPLTPTTWDPTMYRYGFQDNGHYQRYFSMKGQTPDQVVFINSEEQPLSIDDPQNRFATFVKENYRLAYQSAPTLDVRFTYRIFVKK